MTTYMRESIAEGFQTFTGGEYIKIDIAGQYGLDKLNYESRLAWFEENEYKLMELVNEADNPALFLKGIFAWEDAKAGIPTGHVIGFDACASGPQIMSCLVGCMTGAKHTGLVDPKVRQDLYGLTLGATKDDMENKGLVLDTTQYSRKEIKQANMPFFYGSDMRPEEVFGKDTEELDSFLNGMYEVTPGAFILRNTLLNCWQSYALAHEWDLPDGFHVYVPHMVEDAVEIEVDELNHAQFTHIIRTNKGEKKGKSIAANIVHSIDAMVVREMNRRCNYVSEAVVARILDLQNEVVMRSVNITREEVFGQEHRDFLATNVALEGNIAEMDDMTTVRSMLRLEQMMEYRSFQIMCIHDEFKCSPNHMNRLRWWYKEILAELAESYMLEDILNQITGNEGSLDKYDEGLPEIIRTYANYALS